MHGISLKYFQTLLYHVYKHGLSDRVHGNVGNQSHAYDKIVYKRVARFITNFGEEYGMPDPGHIRNRSATPLVLLPSRITKFSVYIAYCVHAKKAGWDVIISRSRFMKEWNEKVDHVKVLTPATDLCLLCLDLQQNLFRSATLNGKMKLQTQWNAHLTEVQERRKEYKNRNAECVLEMERMGILSTDVFSSPSIPSSRRGYLSYDFDFAANMFVPHHARQEGPIYFLTPRKIHIFGVCATFTWKQVFFVLDEGEMVDKSADTVISLLDAFFGLYGLGETYAKLHCDNCSQNKNSALYLWYVSRIVVGCISSKLKLMMNEILPGTHTGGSSPRDMKR